MGTVVSGKDGGFEMAKEEPMKWCEHINKGIALDMSKVNFCPICGTPRPTKPKTLYEKFEDFFTRKYETTTPKYWAGELATIAREHLLDEGWRKP